MSVVPDSHAPGSQGELTPSAGLPEPAPAVFEAGATVSDVSRRQALMYAVGAALVAGFLAWGLGEATQDYFQIPNSAQSRNNFRAMTQAKRLVDQKNTAVAYGALGALMGLLSGATGGALRRSISAGATAALAGFVLGGTGGALASFGLVPIFDRFFSDENAALVVSFLVRAGIWAVVGMTAGLALGWGWQGPGGIPRVLTGGLAGALCGTVAFEVVNAVLFPADRDDAVVPSSILARLLAYQFVSFGALIGAVLAGRHRSTPAGPTRQAHA